MSMGMKDQLHMEFSGSMTRYDPISPEQVAKLSQGGLTYAGFSEILARYGLSAGLVLHDSSRRFLHTYYADFERGVYGCLTVTREFLEGDSACLRALSSISKRGNDYLRDGDWDSYYGLSDPIAAAFSDVSGQVPLPLLIYDFGKRMRMFPPEQVFGIWIAIYRRIDYANGMWAPDTLEYVFKNAPAMEKPPAGENGLVRVYRGMGEMSMPPEKAISWSTDPCNALYFANHSGRGTQFAFADVAPEDIIAFLPGYSYENEVIVRPGSVRDIRCEDMFPAKLETYLKLSLPALPEFTSFGVQAWRLGYKKEGMMEFHGLGHILRVLFLSLIYFYGSGDSLNPFSSTEEFLALIDKLKGRPRLNIHFVNNRELHRPKRRPDYCNGQEYYVLRSIASTTDMFFCKLTRRSRYLTYNLQDPDVRAFETERAAQRYLDTHEDRMGKGNFEVKKVENMKLAS